MEAKPTTPSEHAHYKSAALQPPISVDVLTEIEILAFARLIAKTKERLHLDGWTTSMGDEWITTSVRLKDDGLHVHHKTVSGPATQKR